MNLTSIHGLIHDIAQWVKDLERLWLWCRPMARAPVRLLAWEPPYAAGAALKRKSIKKKIALGNGPPPYLLRLKEHNRGILIDL